MSVFKKLDWQKYFQELFNDVNNCYRFRALAKF